nr:MAG: hypothetical protein [Microvirus Sku111]
MKIRNYWERNLEEPVYSQVPSKSITDQAAVEYTEIYNAMARLSPSQIESAAVAGTYGVQSDFAFADWKDIQACARRDYIKLSPETKKQFPDAESFYTYVSNPENYEMYNNQLMFKTKAAELKMAALNATIAQLKE